MKKCILKSLAPHFARAKRKIEDYQEGNLVCEYCGNNKASKNRQRTAYPNSDNMATLCPECQKEADEYWDEMWNE